MAFHIATSKQSHASYTSAYDRRASGEAFSSPLAGHSFSLTPEDGDFMKTPPRVCEYSKSRNPSISKDYMTTKATGAIHPSGVINRYDCQSKKEFQDIVDYVTRATQ